MATATRRTAGTRNGAATKVSSDPSPAALRFEVYQENSGRHSWYLTTGDGRNLATSRESFASRDDAEGARGRGGPPVVSRNRSLSRSAAPRLAVASVAPPEADHAGLCACPS